MCEVPEFVSTRSSSHVEETGGTLKENRLKYTSVKQQQKAGATKSALSFPRAESLCWQRLWTSVTCCSKHKMRDTEQHSVS